MIKKSTYILLIITALFIIAFLLQPLKRGTGSDTKTMYQFDKNWPALPESLKLGSPTGIDIDTSQQLVVLHRADRKWPLLAPMPKERIKQKTVFFIDRNNGRLLHSWGSNLFIMPHGLTVDHENRNIYVGDILRNTIQKDS